MNNTFIPFYDGYDRRSEYPIKSMNIDPDEQ